MNKKRAILGLLVILLTVGGTFTLTRAFFTDRETSTGSTFTIGTLDMSVGGANGQNVEPFVIANIGEGSTLSGEKTWTIKNDGSLPGRLYFKLVDVKNMDNGCNEPEALVDTTCGTPGIGQGELGNVVNMQVALDSALVASSDMKTASEAVIGNTWNSLDKVIIPAGQTKTVKLSWLTDKTAYGNEIQSDSLTFDIQFDLEQLETPTPTP